MREILFPLIAAALIAAQPAPAQDATPALFSAVAEGPAGDVAARFERLFPPEIERSTMSGVRVFSYFGEGAEVPETFLAALVRQFPDFDATALRDAGEVSLGLSVYSPDAKDTALQLMVGAGVPVRQARAQAPVPEGAVILMDDGDPGGCSGQRILTQSASRDESADIHLAALEAEGFEISAPPGETSFFVGQRPGCAIFLYVEEDTDNRSTVILRYVSD